MYLSRALDNVYVESTYLIRLLGKEIEDRLFDMITKVGKNNYFRFFVS